MEALTDRPALVMPVGTDVAESLPGEAGRLTCRQE